MALVHAMGNEHRGNKYRKLDYHIQKALWKVIKPNEAGRDSREQDRT
jgi:hypothetical protein